MSVQSRIRKIEKKKGIYQRRKKNIIRCKLKKQEKKLSVEEMLKRMQLDWSEKNDLL